VPLWNFGLDRDAYCKRRDGCEPVAGAMASGAGRLLDRSRVYDDLAVQWATQRSAVPTTARDVI